MTSREPTRHDLAPSRQGARDDATPVGTGWLQQSVLLDTARGVATLMMLQGHTLDVVLATDLRAGLIFDAWTFLRGLTSCAFLFLSGFVFVFVTDRRIGRKGGVWSAADRRLRRFVFFLLLGYALHLPVSKLTSLTTMGSAQWRSFLVVDVLQCIAVMLTFLQILAAAVRTPRYRAAVVAGAGVLLVAGMP
ncbi:MAG: heparan-alpha-glucosaminide N-acetyltransferase domain-containing protein, partial [Vicinamibacterales bacterium]